MTTADMAMRMGPDYEKISRRFHADPDASADAFARAWFKLTHRDMGPRPRYMGKEAPAEELIWQDPVPAVDHALIDDADAASLDADILSSGLSISELASTAWASASTFREFDTRGGANGARIRLAPQKDWAVNNPDQLSKVLTQLEKIQTRFNDAQPGGEKVSLADLIVPAGGLRVLGAKADGSNHGVFTDRAGALRNDFFVNVFDLGATWSAVDDADQVFEGCDRASGALKWTGTRVDLIFGSNSELRALSMAYAWDDAGEKVVAGFIAA